MNGNTVFRTKVSPYGETRIWLCYFNVWWYLGMGLRKREINELENEIIITQFEWFKRRFDSHACIRIINNI